MFERAGSGAVGSAIRVQGRWQRQPFHGPVNSTSRCVAKAVRPSRASFVKHQRKARAYQLRLGETSEVRLAPRFDFWSRDHPGEVPFDADMLFFKA